MKTAGLVQDIDFFILYKDPEGLKMDELFMTRDAWSRFIKKFPEHKPSGS